MRKLAVAGLLTLSALGLQAGGEYDSFHFGFRGGLCWSPSKGYGTLGTETPGGSAVGSAKMQLAPTFGLQAQWAAVPGTLNVSLITDFIRPIHKEAGVKNSPISQDMIRGELRFGFAGRGNTNEGSGWFLSPTYNKIRTKSDTPGVPSLAEGKLGGGLGLTSFSFSERYISSFEAGV